jgi:three-Cys-motif partner protein
VKKGYIADPTDGLPARRVGEWTETKHFYVRRYMDAFAKSMKKWDQRVYLDLFAGPGRCFEEEPVPQFYAGSPLIALEYPFTRHVYVETDPVAAAALRQRAPSTSARPVDVLEQDCNDAVPAILKLLRADGLTLAFIDPTNWQIRYDTVAELTKDRRVDLLVTFMVGAMKRVPADAKDTTLDEFFGTDEWRRMQRRRQFDFVGLYREQLAKLKYLPIVPKHDVRVTIGRNVVLYQMCFFSKNKFGYKLWDEITGVDEKGQRRLGTG